MKQLSSSKAHRKAVRLNAATQLAACALKPVSPIAELPCKVTQTLNSGFHIFKPELKPHEKTLQLAKTLLSAAQSIFLCYLWFIDDECHEIESDMCKIYLMMDLTYQGLLAVSWAPAEIIKDKREENTDSVESGFELGQNRMHHSI